MQAAQIYPASSTKNVICMTVESNSYRYFNGRRYYVSNEMQHYYYPGEPTANFWTHRIFVIPSPNWPHRGPRHSTRYSTTSGR